MYRKRIMSAARAETWWWNWSDTTSMTRHWRNILFRYWTTKHIKQASALALASTWKEQELWVQCSGQDVLSIIKGFHCVLLPAGTGPLSLCSPCWNSGEELLIQSLSHSLLCPLLSSWQNECCFVLGLIKPWIPSSLWHCVPTNVLLQSVHFQMGERIWLGGRHSWEGASSQPAKQCVRSHLLLCYTSVSIHQCWSFGQVAGNFKVSEAEAAK